MPTFNIFVFSGANLVNGDGDQPFASNQINAPNPNSVSGTFTHGTISGFDIQIEDTGTGGNTGLDTVFEDDTTVLQTLNQAETFTYQLPNGNFETTTFPAGSQIQAELQQVFGSPPDEYTIVVLRIVDPDGSGFLTVGYAFIGDIPPPGTVLGEYQGGEDAGNVPYADIICFTAGIAIPTPDGARRIEDIQVGDLIVTRDSGVQSVTWVGQTHLSELDLARSPNLRPVMVPKGVMGATRDLIFSRQHRTLLTGALVELMTGHDEVLAAVGHLQGLVQDAPWSHSIVYYHLGCEAHEIVNAEGLWVETLFAIPANADAVQAEALDTGNRIAARPILKKWEVAAVLPNEQFAAA